MSPHATNELVKQSFMFGEKAALCQLEWSEIEERYGCIGLLKKYQKESKISWFQTIE